MYTYSTAYSYTIKQNQITCFWQSYTVSQLHTQKTQPQMQAVQHEVNLPTPIFPPFELLPVYPFLAPQWGTAD